ncbi:MAG: LysE family transporter [Bryobacteraceae bacterium]|jgi:threonine/homoserine/homoserine lactone efflux protein
MLTYLILGMTYAFAAAVQPGPLQTYLISQTLSHGWRRTLPAAFSPLISDGPVIVLVLLVLSRVPAGLTQCLRLAGGVFVLYLAWGAVKAWRRYDAKDVARAPSKRQSVLRAAVVNLLNPNPYISWSLVLGPLLLKGWREAPAHGVALLAGFYGVMVLSLAGTIALFAAARNLGPRVNRVLIGVSSMALAGFGSYLLWAGVGGLR